MSGSAMTCTGPRDGRIFADRCGAPATWICPSGPRCAECAEREMAAIRDGACILAILADKHGTSREALIARYRRIQ